ncbi:MAG: porphobilinogen synthase [bacterium]
MYFPQTRLRRLRQNKTFLKMLKETNILPENLIMPYFVVPGKNIRKEIPSLPGQFHLSIDELLKEVSELEGLGISGIILFGIPEKKDDLGSEAYSEDGVIQTSCKALKEKTRELIVITDVCLCEYTKHGHCGIIKSQKSKEGYIIDNDATLGVLAKIAISQVRAGSDIVAPSDMMDGRVGKIRFALDNEGYKDTPIMSYSAKYASALYSPFRNAADCSPRFGDRTTYQMDYSNKYEALREMEQDIEEGVDILMVKPALFYLDVISLVKERFNLPLCAFSVSGEYAMIKAGAERGFIDEKRVIKEALTSIKRAGADIIITYFAKEYAKEMQNCGKDL